MDIPPSDGPLFVVLINPSWKLAEDDKHIFAEVESFVKELRTLAQDKGLLHRYIFTNNGYSKDYSRLWRGECLQAQGHQQEVRP
jgi:type IV secretory pathway TrbF-like protein